MDWIILVVTLALLLAYLFLRRKDQLSADVALAYLKGGALLIDVRSPAEYETGHLKTAINIPLQQFESLIGRYVQDKNQVLLLHCQSGLRSGLAKNKLNALGYRRAYNLGSYNRAAHIINRS